MPVAKARAFLSGTAHRILLAHKRKHRTRQAIVEALFPASKLRVAAPGHLVQRERLERLGDLIRTLPPRMEQAVRLIYLEQRSRREVARQLRLSVKSVCDAERRALGRLKRLLGEGGDDLEP